MNNISDIKEKIKKIQKNFNPEKATYRIFNDILTEDYTPDEIIEYMGKIKGVEKYPEELKDEFFEILSLLKKISVSSNRVKEEVEEDDKVSEEVSSKADDNTKELKAIIDALEDTARLKKKEAKKIEKEVTVPLEEDLSKTESLDEVVNDEVVDDSTLASKIFKVVLGVVILCFLVAIGLVLFY